MERIIEQPDWDLIDRYLAGECTPAEAEVVRAYMAHQDGLEAGIRAGAANNTAKSQISLDTSWTEMQNRMSVSQFDNKLNTTRRSSVWSRVAVITAVVAVVAVGIKYLPEGQHASPKSQTYTTDKAQRANITLDDGTLVTLAPSSEITATGRNVRLSGEALFIVTNNTGDAFTVRTGNTLAKVLGTTFSVRSYKDELSTRVVVADGKVATNNTVMAAGDVAIVTATNTQVSHNADVESMLGWRDGKLYFDDTRLIEAVPELERWYNVLIRIADREVAQSMVDGTLTARNAEELARTLEFTLKARVERKGNVLTLYRNTPLNRQ